MDENTEEPQSSNPSGRQRFMFQEYWVDFLGGLLPGALFSVTAIYILIPTFVLFINSIGDAHPKRLSTITKEIISATKDTPNTIWIGLSIILISISYILGHIFYRQDPREPNKRSLKRLARNLATRQKIKKRGVKQLQNEFGCSSDEDCEFPYRYFNKYLKFRGLDHLSPLAIWCRKKEHRTKNYINILKTRIRFYFPNNCSTMIKNEAHVRLATSVWYVGRVVRRICLTVLLLWAITLYINYLNSGLVDAGRGIDASSIVAALFTILSGGYLGVYLQSHVEDFLHYQRQREIVHVLELGWIMSLDNSKILGKPFDITHKKIIDMKDKTTESSHEAKQGELTRKNKGDSADTQEQNV